MLRIWLLSPSLTRFLTAVVAHQDLERGHASPADRRQQLLVDHAGQAVGELGTDLLLGLAGEDIHDPVDGLRAVVRVKGRQHQVAGLGR